LPKWRVSSSAIKYFNCLISIFFSARSAYSMRISFERRVLRTGTDLSAGVPENASGDGEHVLRLITLRSHDQYNTTIYALDDRYRGVFGRRDVLFMNEEDMAQSGLEHGDRVDIETALPGNGQRLEDITVVAYNIAPGTVGAYYPEANVLVPLDYLDKDSGTPSYKSVPVRITLRSKEIRML